MSPTDESIEYLPKIDTSAKPCPKVTPPVPGDKPPATPPSTKDAIVGCGCLFMLAMLLIGGCLSLFESAGVLSRSDDELQIDGQVVLRQWVEDKASSPLAVKWPWFAINFAGRDWAVLSYSGKVDLQNAFGQWQRVVFVATVRMESEKGGRMWVEKFIRLK